MKKERNINDDVIVFQTLHRELSFEDFFNDIKKFEISREYHDFASRCLISV